MGLGYVEVFLDTTVRKRPTLLYIRSLIYNHYKVQ